MTFAVVAILLLHYAAAATSLLGENPTVDELLHLPAGITYWQTGTFKLYHQNPPLVKLVASLPVVLARPEMRPAYQSAAAWINEYPSQAAFGQYFLGLNLQHYLALFQQARLVMPVWSVIGGLFIFAWSRRLHGPWGGLLSLCLWCLCPNVLANARLITSDLAAASIGCGATFLFWRYLQAPTLRRALLAGLALGVAQLVKFSMLLLYPLWPLLWIVYFFGCQSRGDWKQRVLRAGGHGVVIVTLSILVIDTGYLFEGVGAPLGEFSFASRSFLTKPGEDPRWKSNPSGNPLLDNSWRHVVNRFRSTVFERFPSPLPRHFLLGFDEQKIDADGIPIGWLKPDSPNPNEITGYPVYLDGTLRRHGWREYYLKTLLYKLPEGTWFLFGLALVVTCLTPRARANFADDAILLLMPLAILGAMSLLTDINIGLRYVLPMLPYIFIFAGKLPDWVAGQPKIQGRLASGILAIALGATACATLSIHPHYLAYFNWLSGGADRGSEHLIDSNLDWGQDLVGLADWLNRNGEIEPVGLVYFGQLSPDVLRANGQGFEWFLPPALVPLERMTQGLPEPPASQLKPGLYAVSATMLRGLPWRLYARGGEAIAPTQALLRPSWNAREHAFAYFRDLKPLRDSIGHSILLYRVTRAEADRINAKYGFPPIRDN